ncbi:hypothetical protein DL98DRAFT_521125, partial [Cadophora sp. DSE1049]
MRLLQYNNDGDFSLTEFDKGDTPKHSINFMFRWYRNASRCYIYLSDVSTRKRKASDQSSEHTWELSFRESRWFTRGWTLQELLALASVEFFSLESKRLESLSQFHIDERMRWIEHRETGQEEDKAYSLLGIFGIFMAPTYSKGVAKAFDRLWDKFREIQKCMQDLRLTDPRLNKERIEATKGGLLKKAYRWIKGDPGKGKTMLLCGIANELQNSLARSALLSYFFCQATDSRINRATTVLRGLIYLLVDQQPSLISHVALTKIFCSILQDPNLDNTYLIVDALDKCVVDLPRLLSFIAQTSSVSTRIKWVISSRNWPEIEKTLDTAIQKRRLCLELNADSVSTAVATFIQTKVHDLREKNKYKSETRDLSNLSKWKAVQKLKALPPGLDALYQRMLDQIMASEDSKLCISVLAVVSTVYRPITIDKLVTLVKMPNRVNGEYKALAEIIGYCRSFLAIRECTIFFMHQSAKDFLIKKAPQKPLLFKAQDVHNSIFSRSLQVMSITLQRDIYNLRAPGISIDQVEPPDPDSLATVRYSCLYWVDHLLKCQTREDTIKDLKDLGPVYSFLRQYFLYWLKAMSLLKSMSEGVVIIRKLEDLQFDKSPNLRTFIQDATRFAVSNRSIIEQAPLQAYCSALIFAPEKSIIKRKPRTLEGHSGPVNSVAFSPDGKQVVSGSYNNMVQLWDAATGAALQTLKGHSSAVNSVAFSPDGKQVVSGSYDKTVRLWDAATGAALQTLEGHSSSVNSVAFSPDGKQLPTLHVLSGAGLSFWDM